MGRNGFSLNFLTSFSEGASWCFLPVSLFTANSLFNWGMRVVMVHVKKKQASPPYLKAKKIGEEMGYYLYPLKFIHFKCVIIFGSLFFLQPFVLCLYFISHSTSTQDERKSAILDEYKLPCTVV